MKNLKAVAIACAVGFMLPLAASAQVDPATITPDIEAVGVVITAIGAAIIGLAVIAMSIRWVKATFF